MLCLAVLALCIPQCAFAEDAVPCDPSVAPGSGGWAVRWGTWDTGAREPAFHVRCDANGISGHLTTALLNASVLEWPAPTGAATVRAAEVSFFVPDLTAWSHIAVLPAYEPVTIGRIGADIFHETTPEGGPRDRLTVQFNMSADVGCGVGNLHAPVPITGGIAGGHWYRLSARVEERRDGGLTVSGVVRDLDAGHTIAGATRFDAPATCTPSWFPADSGWGVGILGLTTGVETYLDDFAAFNATPAPAEVRWSAALDDGVPAELTVAADPDLSVVATDGALVMTTAPGAAGAARAATSFRVLGDFDATALVTRTALAAGDVLGVRAVTADATRAVVLDGPDGIVALDGAVALARRNDPAAAATLRLTRTAGVLAAAIDIGNGFASLATFSRGPGTGEARIELFAERTVADPATPPLDAAIDDVAVTAEQLAVGAASTLAVTSYRSAWTLGGPRFVGFGPVALVDVLGPGTYDVAVPRMLAAPATVPSDTAVTDAVDPTAYLVEYPIAPSRGSAAFVPRAARVVDPCRDVAVLLRKPVSVLVPSTTAFPPEPPAFDHFVCYQATAMPATALARGTQAVVSDAIQTRRYDLGKITKVCNPVDKSGDPVLRTGPQRGTPWPIDAATARDREPHLVCWSAKAAKRTIAQSACGPLVAGARGTAIVPAQPAATRALVGTANQLGAAPLTTIREAEVCTPAALVVSAE